MQHCAEECTELWQALERLPGYEPTQVGWAKLGDLEREEQAARGGLWALLRAMRHVWQHRIEYSVTQNLRITLYKDWDIAEKEWPA